VGTESVFDLRVDLEGIPCHRQVDLAGMGFGRGGDGIEPGGYRLENGDDGMELRGVFYRVDLQQVEQPDLRLRDLLLYDARGFFYHPLGEIDGIESFVHQ